MTFSPSIDEIREIVEKRLIYVDGSIRDIFPDVLKTSPLYWMSFGNDNLLSLIFVFEADMERIRSFQDNNFEPFPGLFTTDTAGPSAFRLEGSQLSVIEQVTVRNGYAFSIGNDSSFTVLDHTQIMETKDVGSLTYRIPLAYFVSFGQEITPDNAYEALDELIAFSVKMWREADASRKR